MPYTLSPEDHESIDRVRNYVGNASDLAVLLRHYDLLAALPAAHLDQLEDVLQIAHQAGVNVSSQQPLQLTFGQTELVQFAALVSQAAWGLQADPWAQFVQWAQIHGFPEPVKSFAGPDSFVNSVAWREWQQHLSEHDYKSDLFDRMKKICKDYGWPGNGYSCTQWLGHTLKTQADYKVDAERWRSLTQSVVMTKMGWAGYGNPASPDRIWHAPDPSGYRHLTVNFWSHRGDDYDPTKYATEQSATVRMLTELVDCRIKLDREYANYCYGALNGRDVVPPKPSDEH